MHAILIVGAWLTNCVSWITFGYMVHQRAMVALAIVSVAALWSTWAVLSLMTSMRSGRGRVQVNPDRYMLRLIQPHRR